MLLLLLLLLLMLMVHSSSICRIMILLYQMNQLKLLLVVLMLDAAAMKGGEIECRTINIAGAAASDKAVAAAIVNDAPLAAMAPQPQWHCFESSS